MDNIGNIVTELDDLKNYISGWDIPREVELYVLKKVNKIKSLLGEEKEIEDKKVFEYEDKNAICQILQTITGEFIFQMISKGDTELLDKEDIWDSAENGIELDDDGVYSTFDKCMEELKDTYNAFFGEDMPV